MAQPISTARGICRHFPQKLSSNEMVAGARLPATWSTFGSSVAAETFSSVESSSTAMTVSVDSSILTAASSGVPSFAERLRLDDLKNEMVALLAFLALPIVNVEFTAAAGEDIRRVSKPRSCGMVIQY
ncbi:hypothetical protein PHYSODRAFT_308216 [Phytophthora sojae]|uniref:Uncharacterized protein n=1 Tax=Phytophthora sojae (strain P6497) TaxID=1094619 RepID=G5AIW1_PHYSP|nr:hypothetical protein PHYSODRAFT_306691 [Phytophthora sojae]XP_009540012.1 hypothetical protein PHYSODRAFT_308216 [Phytophthora sojae]EGZ04516.1 hypothetical protein PHYSODRAFT_308216 [Phytophthora sojae]EGZ07558.1 hypothetical protein PHYSODRAFT_306691 [Phytophthora sojae]|eukprot:XP_009537124.1 hypothetical protein PHYSODRAFT_306691 [Phytophthora sojae]